MKREKNIWNIIEKVFLEDSKFDVKSTLNKEMFIQSFEKN
jgi:hypothetical protein